MNNEMIALVRLPFSSLLEGCKQDYHLGLGYISSALCSHNYKVKLIDGETLTFSDIVWKASPIQHIIEALAPSNFRNNKLSKFISVTENPDHPLWKSFVDKIIEDNPTVVGITCYTQNVASLKIITKKIKKINPKIAIVVGGIHPTSHPEIISECSDIDYVIVGEGEFTMVELCNYLCRKQGTLAQINGLVYVYNGSVVSNDSRILCNNLDLFNFPDRPRNDEYRQQHQIITGRGCPGQCGFCASHLLWSRAVRRRSIESIISEFDILFYDYGAKRIRIVDDTFTNNPDFVTAFCKNFKSKPYCGKLRLSISSRVDTLNSDILDSLSGIGVETISFGIESGSKKILDNIGKHISPEQIKKTIVETSKRKIRCFCNFIYGHPHETSTDVLSSIELFKAIKNRYVECELNIASPYPKTDYWHFAFKSGVIAENIDYRRVFHQGTLSINLTNMSDEEFKTNYYKFSALITMHKVYHRFAHYLEDLISYKLS
jgi:anaerobic magnesium-protoporphyrin IX monomethyl ester cyclase